jgi:hypothetical protein
MTAAQLTELRGSLKALRRARFSTASNRSDGSGMQLISRCDCHLLDRFNAQQRRVVFFRDDVEESIGSLADITNALVQVTQQ